MRSRNHSQSPPAAAAGTLPPEVLREVEELIAGGSKLKAVRRVRQATGWAMRQAKAYVATLDETGSPPPPPSDTPAAIPDNLAAEVAASLRNNQKILAVKQVRQATGWGLKESKDYVDAIERTL